LVCVLKKDKKNPFQIIIKMINQKHNHLLKKSLNFFKVIFLFSLVILLTAGKVNAQNELDVIRNNWLLYTDAPNSLYHYLTGQAYDILKKRADAVSGLNSLTGWQERQKMIKETLLDIVGPFPEKTPLNAKILRGLELPGALVEEPSLHILVRWMSGSMLLHRRITLQISPGYSRQSDLRTQSRICII
jgi:hypothetical protein